MGTTTAVPTKARSRAKAWIAMGVLVVAVVAAFATHSAAERNAEDRRIDGYYCTLSGIGPLDRAPQTGERCVDVLEWGR